MTWCLRLLGIVALAAAVVGGGGVALAQQANEQAPTSFSQFLRSNGYTLSDAEAQYLDSDEQFQFVFAQGLWNVHLLSLVDPAQRTDEWRQALIGELNRLLETDPSQTPQAPASLQRHRDLGVAHRGQVREAARAWLNAVQAGDPEWLDRGGDAYRAALQGIESWQQELLTRFPPPQAQP